MYVDALTLAAVADELQRLIGGARVEDVIQPTPHAVAIQCWTGSRSPWLYLSAHPQLARIHLTSEKPRKLAAEPPPFVMLLRKYLEGCRVMAVQQPRWERLLADVVRVSGFLRQIDAQFAHPAGIGLQHQEFTAVRVGDDLAALRHPSQQRHDQPAQTVYVPFGLLLALPA